MYCAISGEIPQQPVVSRKTGHLFERRLIEKALQASENRCPVTGEELKPEDLLPVACDLAQRPRPLSATSLPAACHVPERMGRPSGRGPRDAQAAPRDAARALPRFIPARRRLQSMRLTKERDDALALARSGQGVVVTQQVDQAAWSRPALVCKTTGRPRASTRKEGNSGS